MSASAFSCRPGMGLLPLRISYSKRHRVRPYTCRSQSQGGHEPITEPERGIFQMSPKCGEATLQDARDALEICSYVQGRYKQECYAQFGCDGERVEQYFGAVEVLENAWEQSEGMDDDDEYVDECQPWHPFKS